MGIGGRLTLLVRLMLLLLKAHLLLTELLLVHHLLHIRVIVHKSWIDRASHRSPRSTDLQFDKPVNQGTHLGQPKIRTCPKPFIIACCLLNCCWNSIAGFTPPAAPTPLTPFC